MHSDIILYRDSEIYYIVLTVPKTKSYILYLILESYKKLILYFLTLKFSELRKF